MVLNVHRNHKANDHRNHKANVHRNHKTNVHRNHKAYYKLLAPVYDISSNH